MTLLVNFAFKIQILHSESAFNLSGGCTKWLVSKLRGHLTKYPNKELCILFFLGVPCQGLCKRTYNKAEDKRGGRGKHKIVRNRNIKRSVEVRGLGLGTRGIQDGHYKDFQEGKQGI